MNKTINYLLILALLLVSSSISFAENGADHTSDGNLNIGGTADSNGDATNTLNIGLSPRVMARYLTDGTSETTAQWYAIATVHPGGNVGYGTAQDVNNVYLSCYTTGDDTATITDNIPVEKNPEPPGTTDAEGNPVAAATWTNNGWSLTPPNCD